MLSLGVVGTCQVGVANAGSLLESKANWVMTSWECVSSYAVDCLPMCVCGNSGARLEVS